MQKEMIIAPIVVIIAIAMIFFTVKKAVRNRPRRIEGTSATDIKAVLPADSDLTPREGLKEITKDRLKESAEVGEYNVEDLPWGRDPFGLGRKKSGEGQNLMRKKELLAQLKLIGIITSFDNPQDSIAVINGENLKIGEMISIFILKEIKSSFIILESDNDKFILRLWEEEIEEKEKLLKPLY